MRIGVVVSCQKLGIILENKVVLKIDFIKNNIGKKWVNRAIVVNSCHGVMISTIKFAAKSLD